VELIRSTVSDLSLLHWTYAADTRMNQEYPLSVDHVLGMLDRACASQSTETFFLEMFKHRIEQGEGYRFGF
jgi:hypothetical protein